MASALDILIVEDEAVLAMVYRKQLQELGYRAVGHAFSGEDALVAMEQGRPKMILLDIKLSGNLDGIEVAEIIHRRHPVPIVYITAYADPETLRRAWLTHPVCILGKIGNSAELDRVVSTIMAPVRETFSHKTDLCTH
jgi:CheY-like chemotaxis protein